ncbi:bifunctional hydroxymethylpyrimidine kinase/phosphomethylpyrimidine kinase [Kineosporia sp. J2-2]|uniref:Bifunctional hydroxymethylpyrimidine kinase/phosphomethylpyrimidine kinase n=1 Tax=Kineosporia corallincola TaxID=2835133 RepID=A0ABS5TEE4_9ACTN|nr:PfkB family carbohydrate kinase [Kineosporia corallincola]MBT0769462.1 bifunctional hydroxymethylpyrimidine kinase/phosphomethylpyrimidine kinase [Kineosporia corallincola]
MRNEWLTPRRALVVGDVMLDVFTEGQASRLSPEAPVPVVLQDRRSCTAGGAGNAAVNLAMLGDEVCLVAAVGADAEGELVRESLAGRGVDVSGLHTGPGPTTSKHRVVARGQQLVRLDVEDPSLIDDDVRRACLDEVRARVESVDVVMISDYAKGMCRAELCSEVIRIANIAGVPVVVDPKGTDYGRYRGATLITPNLDELAAATGEHHTTLHDRARELVDLLGCAVLVTRSAEGMSLFDGFSPEVHLPTQARTVYDVTGAGDTVASVIAAFLARGLSLDRACAVANACAGVVVGRRGTSPITREELLEAWDGLSHRDSALESAL